MTPALDLSIFPSYLLTLESELRQMKLEAPVGTVLLQESSVTASLTAGFHYRTRDFEFGVLAGLGQSMLVSGTPSTSYVNVQNVLFPSVGGRLAYNGRLSPKFYLRLEASYLVDLMGSNDRLNLQMPRGARYLLNSQWGFGSKTQNWLRLTAGFGLHQRQTNIGNQQALFVEAGLCIGNLWGQRRPAGR